VRKAGRNVSKPVNKNVSINSEGTVKVVSIVGARPQFIKAAAVSRVLRERHREILVHTGQHYDYEMSGVFFDGLELPGADVNLGVGSGSHAAQTGAMLKGVEDILLAERPDYLLIYGDTNSTLAGALAASKLSVPVAHVEAGLRSFNRRMPEEINRVVADHLSDLLLCPSDTAVQNLASEGIAENVHLVGDVMLDVLNWARQRIAAKPSEILGELGLTKQHYVLATVHRSENTDDLERLSQILSAFNSLDEPVVFPVHPRARKVITEALCPIKPHVRLIDPVGYLDMITLTGAARLILTDSGGLQKEAYWLGVPCLTMRDETEWVETVAAGWNTLVGSDSEKIVQAVHSFAPSGARPVLYGDGFAAERCVDLLGESLGPIITDAPAAHSILTGSNHGKHTAQEVKN
jgi:UDP-GlcNAc3NAcA epimerase